MTSGGVTIVKVGGAQPQQPVHTPQGGYTRRAKLGDSRSTGRLHTAANTNTHRSMTRLNIAGEIIRHYQFRVVVFLVISYKLIHEHD